MNLTSNIFKKLYFVFFFLLPLVFSQSIIDPTLAPRQIYLSVFCSIVLLILLFEKKSDSTSIQLTKSTLLIPLSTVVLLIAMLFSLTQARVISESYFVLTKSTITVLYFLITLYLLLSKRLFKEELIQGVFLATIITILITIYQVVTYDDINRISATMANKNLLSSALFLCLPFVIIAEFKTKNYKYLKYILILSIILIVFYIRTRAVIIPLILGSIVLGIFHVYGYLKSKNNTKIIVVLSIAFALIISFVFMLQRNKSLGSFTDSNTFNTRVKLWHNTKHIIADNTFLGVGAGNWKFEFENYGVGDLLKEARDGKMVYQQPHNDFLEYFSESGLFAFLSYVSLFAIAGFLLFRLFKVAESMQEKNNYLVLLLSLIGFAFISFFDFPMERIEHQILFYTFLTIIILEFKNRFESNANLLKLNKPGLILFYSIACVILITSLFIGFKRYEGEKGTVQVFVAHQNQDWINLIRLVDETKNKYYKTDPISIPLDWYKGVAQFSLNQFAEAKQTFLQAYAIAPYNIHILNNLASTNEKLGGHRLAVKYYSEALRISPAFEESILNLSAVYFNIGDFDKAYETIDKCPYSCQDAKYIVFLKAILRNKFTNSSDNRIKTIVGNISDDQLVHIYLNSKQKNTNFTTDIINYH